MGRERGGGGEREGETDHQALEPAAGAETAVRAHWGQAVAVQALAPLLNSEEEGEGGERR